eukprot:765232-Hanusia_phi.AAC.11
MYLFSKERIRQFFLDFDDVQLETEYRAYYWESNRKHINVACFAVLLWSLVRLSFGIAELKLTSEEYNRCCSSVTQLMKALPADEKWKQVVIISTEFAWSVLMFWLSFGRNSPFMKIFLRVFFGHDVASQSNPQYAATIERTYMWLLVSAQIYGCCDALLIWWRSTLWSQSQLEWLLSCFSILFQFRFVHTFVWAGSSVLFTLLVILTGGADCLLSTEKMPMIALIGITTILISRRREDCIRMNFVSLMRAQSYERHYRALLTHLVPKSAAEFLLGNDGIHTSMNQVGPSSQVFTSYYHEVTILFIKLNTENAGDSASDFVKDLNYFFHQIDHLVHNNAGLFKVETIGAEYVVASGLPEVCKDHAVKIAKFAVSVKALFHRMRWSSSKKAVLCMGANSGGIIAGIAGKDTPRYRLFGDTINTASRMKSVAARETDKATIPPDLAHISGSTIILSQETVEMIVKAENTEMEIRSTVVGEEIYFSSADLRIRRLGSFEVKGKGNLDLWMLQNDSFFVQQEMEPTGAMSQPDEVSMKAIDDSMHGFVLFENNLSPSAFEIDSMMMQITSQDFAFQSAKYDNDRDDMIHEIIQELQVEDFLSVFNNPLTFLSIAFRDPFLEQIYQVIRSNHICIQQLLGSIASFIICLTCFSMDVRLAYEEDAMKIVYTASIALGIQLLLIIAFIVAFSTRSRFLDYSRMACSNGSCISFWAFFLLCLHFLPNVEMVLNSASWFDWMIDIRTMLFGCLSVQGLWVLAPFPHGMFFILLFVIDTCICMVLYGIDVLTTCGSVDVTFIRRPYFFVAIPALFAIFNIWRTDVYERMQLISIIKAKILSKRVESITQTLMPQHVIAAQTNSLLEHRHKIVESGRGSIIKNFFFAEYLPCVCQMFADIENFTQISSNLQACELFQVVNEVFVICDSICREWNVTKIETIGDGYWCAVGLERPAGSGDGVRLLQAGLAIQRKLSQEGLTCLPDVNIRMRIVVHAGPVIGGVVGWKMPRYHLFGGEVDRLMGMEKFGDVSCVTASQNFMDLLNEGGEGSSRRSDSICSSVRFGDEPSPSSRGSNIDLTLLCDDGAGVEGSLSSMADRIRRPQTRARSLYNMDDITLKKKSISRRNSVIFHNYVVEEQEKGTNGAEPDNLSNDSRYPSCVISPVDFADVDLVYSVTESCTKSKPPADDDDVEVGACTL